MLVTIDGRQVYIMPEITEWTPDEMRETLDRLNALGYSREEEPQFVLFAAFHPRLDRFSVSEARERLEAMLGITALLQQQK